MCKYKRGQGETPVIYFLSLDLAGVCLPVTVTHLSMFASPNVWRHLHLYSHPPVVKPVQYYYPSAVDWLWDNISYCWCWTSGSLPRVIWEWLPSENGKVRTSWRSLAALHVVIDSISGLSWSFLAMAKGLFAQNQMMVFQGRCQKLQNRSTGLQVSLNFRVPEYAKDRFWPPSGLDGAVIYSWTQTAVILKKDEEDEMVRTSCILFSPGVKEGRRASGGCCVDGAAVVFYRWVTYTGAHTIFTLTNAHQKMSAPSSCPGWKRILDKSVSWRSERNTATLESNSCWLFSFIGLFYIFMQMIFLLNGDQLSLNKQVWRKRPWCLFWGELMGGYGGLSADLTASQCFHTI